MTPEKLATPAASGTSVDVPSPQSITTTWGSPGTAAVRVPPTVAIPPSVISFVLRLTASAEAVGATTETLAVAVARSSGS